MLIATESKYYKNLGIDLVAMCVNDLIVNGGQPIFFLDYISSSKINEKQFISIIKSIHEGCEISNCSLIGGETAEMPGIYKKNDFDMAGFAVGMVERDNLLKGQNIKSDALVFGLASSGFHSNGFSLIRDVLKKNNIDIMKKTPYHSQHPKLFEDLLIPTQIYVKTLLPLIKKKLLISMAHITGGGITENLKRIIPDGYHIEINLKDFILPARFSWIAKKGNIEKTEMLKTFNCGIGMILVLDKKNVDKVLLFFKSLKVPYYQIGTVIKEKNRNKVVIKNLNLNP